MAAERAGIRHRTMAEAALDELREAIILGELVPGTPLRLEDLAASLGMSIDGAGHGWMDLYTDHDGGLSIGAVNLSTQAGSDACR